MKSTFLPLLALLLLIFTACEKDEIDVAANTDFPPSILSTSPTANGRALQGQDFDIVVRFADGTTSPLSSATISVVDSMGTELASTSRQLSGTLDSIVLSSSEFVAQGEELALGIYTVNVSVTDASNQTTEMSFNFESSLLPFSANNEQMWIAGGFNSWTTDSDEMELVADFTWRIENVDLMGAEWKFKNRVNFGDEDWGDTNCDGFMESNQSPGGNGNTNCGFSGLVTVTFNDQTLAYSVAQQVTLESNTMALYLLGSFNNFQGSDFQFELVDDNTWVLEEVLLNPGDQFRFAEMPDFSGINYGDNENDSTFVAEQFGSNFAPDIPEPGFYRIDFNDQTLAYSITFLRPPFPSNVGIIGNATPMGWDSDTDMTQIEDGIYEIIIGLGDGLVKFRADDAWEDDWGATAEDASEFPTGTAVFKGANIPVTAGLYIVTLNLQNLTYEFREASIGIIGDATPGGWEADTDLTQSDDNPSEFSTQISLTDGVVKWRLNDEWDDDWGADSFPSGTASFKGPNLAVTAGDYTFTFNINTLEYRFE